MNPLSNTESYVEAQVEWVRKPNNIDANLRDYDAACRTFDWKTVEREFDWHTTGRVNIVHEAIDRHAAGGRADKADRKSTRLNSSHSAKSRMPSSA